MVIYNQNFFHTPMMFTKAQVDLRNHLRMLWEQHDVWTRSAIVSIVFGLPDLDFVVARLLRNPVDFEHALQPFYGDRIAATFRDLLKNHLVIAADLVKAAKAGNTTAAAEAERKWYANAGEIAVFLGNINPFWSQDQWRNMMNRHLALVKAQAVNMLSGQFATSIAAYDENELHTLGMADVMAEGIIKQFNIF
ncbi:MAG: acetylglutamate kinase [Desulfotomaculaceae bacterium]|nr:acetylglutamate kinase [Desulfotomaculaceae bacterium]